MSPGARETGSDSPPPRRAGRLTRPLLVVAGLVSTGVGIVGIALPVLPTTPFLILAAWCFARSSERLHRWLVTHRRFGVYIVGFVYGGGIPRRAKLTAIAVLWASISVSCVVIVWRLDGPVPEALLVAFLVVMAAAVSAFILTRPSGDRETTPEGDARPGADGAPGEGHGESGAPAGDEDDVPDERRSGASRRRCVGVRRDVARTVRRR